MGIHQDHARQCGRVVFTDVFSSGSGKCVHLPLLPRHRSAPLAASAARASLACASSHPPPCRKGVIEYNSREEMEDAIRKLDSTRVGDRGENLIRVYKVCAGLSARCLLGRCLLGRLVAVPGVGLRAAAA